MATAEIQRALAGLRQRWGGGPPPERMRVMVAVALLASAGLLSVAGIASQGRSAAEPARNRQYRVLAAEGGTPTPPDLILRQTTPEQALALNASIPFSSEVNQPAAPFHLDRRSASYGQALDCLASAVYYEAAGQGAVGEGAVAQVILNRVRHPAFPNSICAVVYQGSTRPTGCQFTFTCDGSLLRQPSAAGWAEARSAAAAALAGQVIPAVGLATHYHANYVVPYWASSLAKNALVGVHIFYRWPGVWGTRRAFSQRYNGEPLGPARLRIAALMAHGEWPDGLGVASPGVTLDRDPQVDLLSVLWLLADEKLQTPASRQVRDQFSESANDAAVQLYRTFLASQNGDFAATVNLLKHYSLAPAEGTAAAASPHPEDAAGVQEQRLAMVSAIRQFAASPRYLAFAGGGAQYSSWKLQAARQFDSVLDDLRMYTGVTMGKTRMTAAPLLGALTPALSACSADDAAAASGTRGSSTGDSSLGTRLPTALADYMLWATSVGSSAAREAARASGCSSHLDQQIIGAILSRVAALKGGEAAGRARSDWEVRHGHWMVPELVRRLRSYEQGRDRFATLGDFYAELAPGARTPARGDDPSFERPAITASAAPPRGFQMPE